MSNSIQAAVLFTDIVGYSKMMDRDEKRAVKLLAEHDKIIEAEIKPLDRAEGCGYGYDKRWVDVETEHGNMRAFTYVASHTYIDPEQLPFPWYKRYVVEGVWEHEFPGHYIAQVRHQKMRRDPDRKRQREHDEFIEGNVAVTSIDDSESAESSQ